jgi:hypothetical protein
MGASTQGKIQTIVKNIRLPYVFRSLYVPRLWAFWSVLLQKKILDRPFMLSINLQKSDLSPAINGNRRLK